MAEDDDYVDLRQAVLILFKRWQLIRDVLIVVLTSAAAVWSLSPRTYEATARVLVVQTASYGLDAKTWRTTLASLVPSPLIGKDVVTQMGDRLPIELRSPDVLARMVEGKPGRDAQIIDIVVHGPEPSLVGEVANDWASIYEQRVNQLYGSSGAKVVAVAVPATPPVAPVGKVGLATALSVALASGAIIGTLSAWLLDWLWPEAPTPCVPWLAPARWTAARLLAPRPRVRRARAISTTAASVRG